MIEELHLVKVALVYELYLLSSRFVCCKINILDFRKSIFVFIFDDHELLLTQSLVYMCRTYIKHAVCITFNRGRFARVHQTLQCPLSALCVLTVCHRNSRVEGKTPREPLFHANVVKKLVLS